MTSSFFAINSKTQPPAYHKLSSSVVRVAYQFIEEFLVIVGKLSKLLISQNLVNFKIRDKTKGNGFYFK